MTCRRCCCVPCRLPRTLHRRDRPGGFTRVVRSGFRERDGAETAYVELVDREGELRLARPIPHPSPLLPPTVRQHLEAQRREELAAQEAAQLAAAESAAMSLPRRLRRRATAGAVGLATDAAAAQTAGREPGPATESSGNVESEGSPRA